ncbi:MAG: hypothetical protein AAF717_09470 [Bacteroidota bacterium]
MDAGNPFAFLEILIYHEMEAMQDAGIPAGNLMVMTTNNHGLAMERSFDYGTLENRKVVDLIIMDKDPFQ